MDIFSQIFNTFQNLRSIHICKLEVSQELLQVTRSKKVAWRLCVKKLLPKEETSWFGIPWSHLIWINSLDMEVGIYYQVLVTIIVRYSKYNYNCLESGKQPLRCAMGTDNIFFVSLLPSPTLQSSSSAEGRNKISKHLKGSWSSSKHHCFNWFLCFPSRVGVVL